ncbi:lachesin-like [Portunus trituberculatus]|uniref:lachesin-like n=1 Tax=Portunus trituberculatus TaxID=210409 RepID=UPI001E1D1CA5|nr:lachesin-like [Portunus trituberculatus]XP_045121005.1 lachesin-like [Portunus trituberculatus]XP_045121006.1 lachesin-like [Portunus trituberculatus]XP_045121007.1 lachesin-like [Portunus trituberculatus]
MRRPANLYLATLWLVSIKGAWSTGLPRVWWLPGTAVEEGGIIALQCQVAGVGPAIWLKLDPQDPNNHELLSHGDMLIMEDPRFSVSHNRRENIFVLQIDGVSAADAGSYQCQVPVSPEEEELKVEAAPPVVVTLLTERPDSSSSLPSFSPFCLLLLLLLLGLAR